MSGADRKKWLVALVIAESIGVWGQTSSTQPTTKKQVTAQSGGKTPLPRGTSKSQVSSSRPATLRPRGQPSINLLGSVATASPAESFAINGNYAYTCDDNEISVIDISNPSNPMVVATATSTIIQNSGDINCAVQRNTLAVFSDQVSSTIGNTPGFVAFDLTSPLNPQLIQATSIDKRFFQPPVFLGNVAFVPTAAITHFGPTWDNQYGDLLSIDLTNFSNPVLDGTLEQPQIDPVYGGATAILGATQSSGNLLYLGGSTSTGNANNGLGRLQVVDVTNPAAMKTVAQLLIPGTIQLNAPLIQGTVAVGVGNTLGYGNNGDKINRGNVVVAVFDVSDPRAPAVLSITTTAYPVAPGGGQTLIGANLFAFAGVVDSNNNNVLLIVDATNPLAPAIQSIPIPQPITSMQAVGTTLYATLGSGGFAAYSIPGISTTTAVCPVYVDAMLVLDRGANIPSGAFLNAESALGTFISSLNLPPDQVGVASFATSATVNQTLTNNGALANAAFNGVILAGGGSYIGSGIAAAQGELTSSRHNPAATPIIVLISDGVDKDAPTSSATLAAANAAKAAGIQIIAVQYGTGSTTLMQSIASSSGSFYQVTQ